MPRVRALVPLEDVDGPIDLGQVVDVSDEQAADWRANGKVSLISDEEAAEARLAAEGHYSDVTGRDEAAEPEEDAAAPIPPAEKKKK